MKILAYLFPFALAGILISCAGCCTSHGKIQFPNGAQAEFDNQRMFWSTEQYCFGYTTNSVTLNVTKSNPDAQTIGALVDLVKTAKP